MTEAQQSPSPSIVTYRVGGREYPMRMVRSCKVCRSPYRAHIEEYVASGYSYRQIVDHLGEQLPDLRISVENLSDHVSREHLPLALTSIQQIAQDRAVEVGRKIEQGNRNIADGITLLRSVVQKSFERIASGAEAPEISDGIRAAKMLADLGEYDTGSSGLDRQSVIEAFMVYHEQAQSFMSPEQYASFGEALSRNPVLAALAAKYDGDGETVPGEVVDQQQVVEQILDEED